MAITRWRPFGSSLERWEPWGGLDALRQEMNSLFEQFGTGWPEGSDKLAFIPSAEMDETDTEIHLKLEVPGMHAEDLDIEVSEEAVSVSGERKSESKTEEKGMTRSEFHYGKFERVIPMPSPIITDQVTANYEDGVLMLTIPKSKEEKKESVKVKVAA